MFFLTLNSQQNYWDVPCLLNRSLVDRVKEKINIFKKRGIFLEDTSMLDYRVVADGVY